MLLTIKQVKKIEKKKFAKVTFNLDYWTFVIYIAALNPSFDLGVKIYLLQKAHLNSLNSLFKG